MIKPLNTLKILSFVFLTVYSISAQPIAKKWKIIQELPDAMVYIDTTSIKEFDNQLSVLGLMSYKTPQNLPTVGNNISSVKTQYLFNAAEKTYTVIGTLYYDSNGKIVGESSIPGYSVSTNNFAVKLVENTPIYNIYKRSVDYLNGVQFPVEDSFANNFSPKDTSQEETSTSQPGMNTAKPANPPAAAVPYEQTLNPFDQSKKDSENTVQNAPAGLTAESAAKNIETNKKNNPEIKVLGDSTAIKNVAEILEQDSLQEASTEQPDSETVIQTVDLTPFKDLNTDLLTNSNSDSSAAATEENEQQNTPEPEPEQPVASSDHVYDNAHETNPESTIFTDGVLYCFQVSSWRHQSYAEEQAGKLKDEGHNAFVVEAHPASIGGTWFRVRIGYFNSLSEARDYMRKMKLPN